MTKKTWTLGVLILIFCMPASAQLKGLMKKVQNKVNERVEKKALETVDKTIDKAESPGNKSGSGPVDSSRQATAPAPVDPARPALASFAQSDFVPGEEILYYDDFAADPSGELAAGWNTNGSAEVLELEKFSGHWLRLHQSFTYLTRSQPLYTDNFTVEFDLILDFRNKGYLYPWISFGTFASGDEPNSGNQFLADRSGLADLSIILSPGEFRNSRIQVESHQASQTWFRNEGRLLELIEAYYGKPLHVAMQLQKERFRLWVQGEKIFDLPKAIPPGSAMNQLSFEVHPSNYAENEYGIYVGNIRVAKSVPDNRQTFLHTGRLVTHAIRFDPGSARLTAESEAPIREMALLLREHPEIRLQVLGHTDAVGTEEANLLLSKQRAQAVVDKLVKDYSIPQERLLAEGKGESSPLADNGSAEGRAANRRVEFIRQ